MEYTKEQKIKAIHYVIAQLEKRKYRLGLCYWFGDYFLNKHEHSIIYEELKDYIPEVFDTEFARKKYAKSANSYWWSPNQYQRRIDYLKECLKQMQYEKI